MGYKTLQFPKGTQFLVTGGAGFIGSNLCEAILNLGYRVRCLDDLSTGKQANVDMFLGRDGYEFVKGDIKDFNTCIQAAVGTDGYGEREIPRPKTYRNLWVILGDAEDLSLKEPYGTVISF